LAAVPAGAYADYLPKTVGCRRAPALRPKARESERPAQANELSRPTRFYRWVAVTPRAHAPGRFLSPDFADAG